MFVGVSLSLSMGVRVFVCNFNKSSGFTVNIYFAEQTFHCVASLTNQWWRKNIVCLRARAHSFAEFKIWILKSSCENCWSWNVRIHSSKQNWTNQKFPFRNSRMNLILSTRYVCVCGWVRVSALFVPVVCDPPSRNHHAAAV